jgi:hypothetical protein
MFFYKLVKKNRPVKNRYAPPIFNYLSLLLLFATIIISCNSNHSEPNEADRVFVKNSVTMMATSIARDISAKGPKAWLTYFENAPGFFMATDGHLAFKDYPTAKTFVLNTVVKMISKISLSWENMRVDPLSPAYGSFGADFHEDIVLSNGNKLSVGGYFTATAHFDGHSWKLRNLNWATKMPDKFAR